MCHGGIPLAAAEAATKTEDAGKTLYYYYIAYL
jgi:hypothetical protein